MKYRQDINGLRAYAVLVVVLYHFWPNLLPGGFVGVDVFFVISGYLMTGIVIKGIDNSSFKLSSFYIARVDRIVPALVVMIFIVSLFGYFILPHQGLKALGLDAFGSLFFISNIIYSLDSGYFSTHSLDKWFLHTWSLSVEWQFYLIFPICLLLLHKLKISFKSPIAWLILIILIFIYSLFLSKNAPLEAFFHIQSRAWELLAGGLLYLTSFKIDDKYKKITEIAGLVLIISSAILFNKWKMWPGYLALVPVLGTCLVILADSKQSIFTHNSLFQYIGKRSYSLYLWHWPIVVAINYWGNTNVYIQLTALAVAFVLAAISFQYVEKGAVSSIVYTKYKKFIYLVIFTIAGVFFIFTQYKSNLDSDNLSYSKIASQQVMPTSTNGYCFKDFNTNNDTQIGLTSLCSLGTDNKKSKVLLFGDSFAGQYEPLLDEFAKRNNFKIDSVTTNWCHASFEKSFFPNQESHPSFQQCLINRDFLANKTDSYNIIILAGAWANISNMGYLGEVQSVVESYVQKGKIVYLLPSPVNYDMDLVKKFQMLLFNGLPFDASRFTKTKDSNSLKVHQQLLQLASKYSDVHFIERSHLYNTSDQFIIEGIEVPYSLDGSHISLLGSKALLENFSKSDSSQQLLQDINK